MSEESDKPNGSIAIRVLVNGITGAGNRVAKTAIGFFLTPIIVAALGLSQYGMFAVVGSLTGYLGLLDFGLGGTFVKFLAEYVERKDHASARQVVVFAMIFYLAFGLVLAAPVLIFAPQIVHLFKMPADQYGTAAWLLRISFGLLVVALASGVPSMVVVAMQRMDLGSRNNFVAYLAYALATFVLLRLHYGLTALIVGVAAQILLNAVLQSLTAHRLFGSMWHNPLRIDGALVKRMFGFGSWTQMVSIFGIINLDVGRFIAAGIVSVASVGLYEISSKLAFFVKSFPAIFLDALMPAAARTDARSDEATLDRMYAVGTRGNVFFTFACTGFVIAGADPIIRVWIGRAYPYVSTIIFWLVLGYAFNSVGAVGATILRAAGKPRYEAQCMGVAVIANAIATFILARPFGIVGVAMGTALGWLVGTCCFLLVYHRVRPSQWWGPIGSSIARVIAANGLSAGAFWYVVHAPMVARLFEHRFLGLAVLGVLGGCYLALFIGLSILFGAWVHDGAAIVSRLGTLGAGFRNKLRPPLGSRA